MYDVRCAMYDVRLGQAVNLASHDSRPFRTNDLVRFFPSTSAKASHLREPVARQISKS